MLERLVASSLLNCLVLLILMNIEIRSFLILQEKFLGKLELLRTHKLIALVLLFESLN